LSAAHELVGIATAGGLLAASLGAGRALLALFGVGPLRTVERRALELGFGVGVLGWLGCFLGLAGLFQRPWLIALAVLGAAGLLLRTPHAESPPRAAPPDGWCWVLVAVLALLAAFDLAEAFSPPADADTLAYHFELPRRYLEAGGLFFLPRAVDGAAPMLLHMTYVLALGIGGERALTLWAGLLGWAPALLVYAVALRHLERRWALAIVALLVSTPAVVYGGGAGQIETKLILFAVAGCVCAAKALRTGEARWAALAGIAAGFYLASKYNGVFFIAACGLALLLQRRWLSHGVIFGALALIAGGEWFVWNAAQSGDPMFPLLYTWFGAKDGYWSEQAAAYLNFYGSEAPAPAGLWLLISYPVRATLSGAVYWESGRTGLGPYGFLILPFALAGAWLARDRIRSHPLAVPVLIAMLFYLVWILSGTSQRVRHVLPLYPILLIAATLAAVRFAERLRVTAPLAAAIALAIIVQTGGAAAYGMNYVRHLATGESREAFLARTVARYGPVPWINAHLGPGDRLLYTERQIAYLIDVPTYGAFPHYQNLIDLRPGESDPKRFLAEIRALGISHVLMAPSLAEYAAGKRHIWTDELGAYLLALQRAGCVRVLHTDTMVAPLSRTVPTFGSNTVSSDVVAIDRDCRP
jgi:4-amino-4-deoxy-L-arabinose transferase-like glycosyltransferase